jgi:hypothetical protein
MSQGRLDPGQQGRTLGCAGTRPVVRTSEDRSAREVRDRELGVEVVVQFVELVDDLLKLLGVALALV